ncbi:NucA/NucB deoxyribonuclease domain-containing protein [Brevibacillus agri]|uniref:NucA/NucB deoxyribonuclease domain-containing protein n=1 Tax=Brevibacillus agri TaxID=51101 RepID=UPI002E1F3703|nr:NucA/NucB deoxyribonuclease domain-containing protein [Brevibacillus agri]
MKVKRILFILAFLLGLGYFGRFAEQQGVPTDSAATQADVILHFPRERYPETAQHIRSAIEKGQPAVCTIDRKAADKHREESLSGIPTKRGYDRDEWPMAMCKEGGKGADIAYVSPSDNRGAGSWIANQLEDYPDGTRVQIVIDDQPAH